jgi:hypothetical protein
MVERVGAEVELRAPAEDPAPRAPSPAKKKKSPATGCCGGRTGSLREDQLREEKKRALQERRKSMTLRQIVYTTMDDPDFSGLGKFWSLAMMVIILFSTLAFILESEVCQSTTCVSTAGILPFEASMFFYVSEWVCVVIFTVDYVLRLTCVGGPMRTLKFIINPMNVVDLVAFAPFWILGAMDDPPFAVPSLDSAGGSAFGFVRAIRLVRVFRVFKQGKLALGFKMMAGAIANSMETMSVLMIVMGVVVTLFSSIMHLIEAPGSALATDELIDAAGMGPCLLADGNRTADCMQSICFGTIPSTFWWAFTTMTTVGYGDCYPVTWAGKMVSVLTFIVGIGVLGLIVTVLGNNFSAQVEMYEEEAAAYAEVDMTGDGELDEEELRQFLLSKKKEGRLRKDVDTKVGTIMEKYDMGNKGFLDLAEFEKMQAEVLSEAPVDVGAEVVNIKAQLKAMEAKLDALTALLSKG